MSAWLTVEAVGRCLGMSREWCCIGMTQMVENATGDAKLADGRAPGELPLLADVQDVAAMLTCSARHVYRLADAGRMPTPHKIGALCRWDRAAIQQWIADGCRPVRTGKGGAR